MCVFFLHISFFIHQQSKLKLKMFFSNKFPDQKFENKTKKMNFDHDQYIIIIEENQHPIQSICCCCCTCWTRMRKAAKILVIALLFLLVIALLSTIGWIFLSNKGNETSNPLTSTTSSPSNEHHEHETTTVTLTTSTEKWNQFPLNCHKKMCE